MPGSVIVRQVGMTWDLSIETSEEKKGQANHASHHTHIGLPFHIIPSTSQQPSSCRFSSLITRSTCIANLQLLGMLLDRLSARKLRRLLYFLLTFSSAWRSRWEWLLIALLSIAAFRTFHLTVSVILTFSHFCIRHNRLLVCEAHTEEVRTSYRFGHSNQHLN